MGQQSMKSRVLAKTEAVNGGWVGNAYGHKGIIAIGTTQSEFDLLTVLRCKVEDYLATYGAAWLQSWQSSESSGITNCPEGAIKLPIDLWACKLVRQTCPIQAQVFMSDRERFFAGCLAPKERKQEIFETIASGKCAGFHHIPGRYLCARCEEAGGKPYAHFHYPWELASLEDFAPFEPMRDILAVLRAGLSRAAVLHPLCTKHAVEVAQVLYPDVAAQLHVLEFNIGRPS